MPAPNTGPQHQHLQLTKDTKPAREKKFNFCREDDDFGPRDLQKCTSRSELSWHSQRCGCPKPSSSRLHRSTATLPGSTGNVEENHLEAASATWSHQCRPARSCSYEAVDQTRCAPHSAQAHWARSRAQRSSAVPCSSSEHEIQALLATASHNRSTKHDAWLESSLGLPCCSLELSRPRSHISMSFIRIGDHYFTRQD